MRTALEVSARIDEVTTKRDELYKSMMGVYESDTPVDPESEVGKKYEASARLITTLDSEKKTLLSELEIAKSAEQSLTRKVSKSAVARAFAAYQEKGDPKQGLEEWEFPLINRELDAQERKAAPAQAFSKDVFFRMTLGEDETSPTSWADDAKAEQSSLDSTDQRVLPKRIRPGLTERLTYVGDVGNTVAVWNTPDGNPEAARYRDANRKGTIRTAQGTAIAAPNRDAQDFKAVIFHSLTGDSGEMTFYREWVRDFGPDLDMYVRREGLRAVSAAFNEIEVKRPAALNGVMQGMVDMGGANVVRVGAKGTLTVADINRLITALPYQYRIGDEGNRYGFRQNGDAGMLGLHLSPGVYDQAFSLVEAGRPVWAPLDSSSLGSGAQGLIRGLPYSVNAELKANVAGGAQNDAVAMMVNGNYFAERRVAAPEVAFFFDSRTAVAGNEISYIVWDARFFGPTGALSAGTGTDDATRSDAVALLQLS